MGGGDISPNSTTSSATAAPAAAVASTSEVQAACLSEHEVVTRLDHSAEEDVVASTSTTTTTSTSIPVTPISLHALTEFPAYARGSEAVVDGLVSLRACTYEAESRPSIDLMVVLDVSGSMFGEKLALARKSLMFILKQLRPCDRFGLVTFSHDVSEAVPLANATKEFKEQATQLIDLIAAKGNTNLSGGIQKAMDIMTERSTRGTVSSVLILTDGQANSGITDPSEIVKLVSGHSSQFTMYTFGYGADHDASLLKRISDVAEGMYYFVESNQLIPQAFADCLGGLLSTVAQNITLTLKVQSGGAAITKMRTSRPVTISADGLSATVAMGDLQSDEERDILFQLALPAAAGDPSHVTLWAEVSFFSVITKESADNAFAVSIARPEEVPAGLAPQQKIMQQRARVDATEAMENSMRAAEQGNLREARDGLESALKRIVTLEDDDFCKHLVKDLRRCLADVEDRRAFKDRGSYTLSSCLQTHSAQRCNVTTSYSPYATPSRITMRDESEDI